MEKIGGKYHPDLVLLCLDMTDFHDDIKYRDQLENPRWFSPFTFSFTASTWRRAGPSSRRGCAFQPAIRRIPEQRYFILNQPLAKSRRYLGEIERNIRSIDDFCREKLRAKFVLIMLPRNIQYSARETPNNKLEPGEYLPLGPYVLEPFAWLEEFRQKVKFPVFSMLADFRDSGVFPTCFATDPHWNRDGHAVAARGVFRVLEELAASKSIVLPLLPKD